MLGHEAGGCPVCRPPAHDAASTRLLALLAVQEAGLRGMPSRLIRLTWLARSA
jgi:hypothetical protein